MVEQGHQFEPDYLIPPGEILEETLAARGIKKSEFAERCGRPAKTISEIIAGKAAITPETAIQFERVLGVSASLWTNLEARYRLRLARLAEEREATKHDKWVKSFPLREMVKVQLIEQPQDEVDAVQKLLDFFGAGSVGAWLKRFDEQKIAYRRSPSFESSPTAVATWLRWGERIAESIDCRPYNEKQFKEALLQIRALTGERIEVFRPQMRELCASSGVAVVFTRELPGTRLSGATRWLTKDKALIQLSLRHKSNDHLWFTFFHEAGHILLHGKKSVFIDDPDTINSEEEEEANRFAADFLIPSPAWRQFVQAGIFSAEAVRRFAKELGIAPGIVVGRLQHERLIHFSRLNNLKYRFIWKN